VLVTTGAGTWLARAIGFACRQWAGAFGARVKPATARPGGIRSIGRYRVRLSAWMLIVVTSAVLLKGVPRLGSAVADLTERDVKEERDRAVD
jgi:hypothetical protein